MTNWLDQPTHTGWWYRWAPGAAYPTLVYIHVGDDYINWGWDEQDDPERVEPMLGERWLAQEDL